MKTAKELKIKHFIWEDTLDAQLVQKRGTEFLQIVLQARKQQARPAASPTSVMASPDQASFLNGPSPWCLEDIDVGAPLGSGKFGKVYVARERRERLGCVAKRVTRAVDDDGFSPDEAQARECGTTLRARTCAGRALLLCGISPLLAA